MTSEHIFNTVRADTFYGSGAGLTSIDPTTAIIPMPASSVIHTNALGQMIASTQLAPSMGGTGADLSATTGGLTRVLANTDGTIANGAALVAYGSDVGTVPVRGTTGIVQTGAQGFTCDALGTELVADREFVQLVWDSVASRFTLRTQATGTGILRDIVLSAAIVHVPGRLTCEYAPVDVEDVVRKADLDAIAAGIAWKSPVLEIADEPVGAPTGGDRYIALSTAGTWTINNIYEWDAGATAWIESVPTTGWACLVLGGAYYPNQSVVFTMGTISEWKPMGISIDHYNLIHRGTNTHDQIDTHLGTITTDPHAGQDLRATATPTHASLTLAHATAPALTFDGSAAAGATSLTLGIDGIIAYARTDPGTTGQTGLDMANGWIATGARVVAPLLAPSTGAAGVRVAPDDDVHVATHALESYSATGDCLRLVRTGAPDASVAFEIAAGGELYVDAPIGAQMNGPLGIGMASSADSVISALSATDDQFRAHYDASKWMAIHAESDGSATLSCATAGKPIYVDTGNPFVITSTDAEALVVDGGAYIGSTLPATSAGTGALIVAGGASFGEGARVDGTATTGVLRASRAGDLPQASFDDTLSDFRIHVNGTALANTVSLYSYGATLGGSMIYLGTLDGAGAAGIPVADVDIAGNASFGASINGGVSTYIALTCDTDSSSADTGSIHTAGGIGCARNLYVGGGMHIVGAQTYDGIVTVANTTASTSTATGCAVLAGGLGVAGAVFTGGAIRTNATTASTSTITGALICDGGAGIAGAAYINTLHITDTTSSASSTTGCAVFDGGIGSAGDAWFGGRIYAMRAGGYPQLYVGNGSVNECMFLHTSAAATGRAVIYYKSTHADPVIRIGSNEGASPGDFARVEMRNTAASTNTTTGALVVTGGVGIGGALNVGGAFSCAGLTFIGPLIVSDTTASTSATTGCATFAGGIGVTGRISCDTRLQFSSVAIPRRIVLYQNADDDYQFSGFGISSGVMRYQIGVTTNSHRFYAGVDATSDALLMRIDGALTTGSTRIYHTTASTTTGTGALIVDGGLGVAGAIFVGGAIRTTSTTASSSVSTGSLIANGGLGVATNAYIGGLLRITDTTTSTTTATGCATFAGGIGVAENAYINTLRVTSTTEADGTTGCATFGGGVSVAARGYFGGQLYAHRLGSYSQFTVKNGVAGTTELRFFVGGGGTAGQACMYLTSDVTRNLFIGSYLDGNAPSMHTVTFPNTAASTSSTTGAVVFGGGIGVGGNIFVPITTILCVWQPGSGSIVPWSYARNVYVQKMGNIVTIYTKDAHQSLGSAADTTCYLFGETVAISLDAAYRPSTNTSIITLFTISSVQVIGKIIISTSGGVTIQKYDGSAFGGTPALLIGPFSISYPV